MTTAQAELDEAREALARKDLDAARSILAPMVIDKPRGVQTFLLARTEVEAGRLDVAQDLLDAFFEFRRDHAGARALRARIHVELGELEPAREEVEKALAINPELPMAKRILLRLESAERMTDIGGHVATIDKGVHGARQGKPTARVRAAAEALQRTPLEADWANDAAQAKAAYFHNATDLDSALRNYDPHLISVSADFGYVTWPKRIQEYVAGRSVLDVGCGFGGFGMGFLVAGATSYLGLDPAMDLDSTRAKNKRVRTWSDMGITPRDIAETLPAIRLLRGTAEDLAIDEKFDTIALHNVTEHLLQLDDVFAGLLKASGPETDLVFLHHNFYCWNGHHKQPNRPDQLDPDNVDHQDLYDWRHIKYAQTVADDHYFRTGLNQIRLDELREITERYFEIERWEELPSSPETLERLDGNVLRRVRRVVPGIERRELATNTVFCVARPQG